MRSCSRAHVRPTSCMSEWQAASRKPPTSWTLGRRSQGRRSPGWATARPRAGGRGRSSAPSAHRGAGCTRSGSRSCSPRSARRAPRRGAGDPGLRDDERARGREDHADGQDDPPHRRVRRARLVPVSRTGRPQCRASCSTVTPALVQVGEHLVDPVPLREAQAGDAGDGAGEGRVLELRRGAREHVRELAGAPPRARSFSSSRSSGAPTSSRSDAVSPTTTDASSRRSMSSSGTGTSRSGRTRSRRGRGR